MKETVARNMKVRGEVSDGNEEHVIGNWRKGGPCSMYLRAGEDKHNGPCALIVQRT